MKTFHLLSLLSILILTSCNEKAEWGKWRGPNGDAVSLETGWSASNLTADNVLWKKDIGFGHSAIVVSGNRCFAAGWKEEITDADTSANNTLYCFNTNNGNEEWKFSYKSKRIRFAGPRSTPAVDGNNIYFIGQEGKLFCLNAANGNEKWQIDLAADSLTVIEDNWGYTASPVISGNLILLNMNSSGIAIDKTNGKVVWNSAKTYASFASVTLCDFNGKKCGIFEADSTIRIIDVTNGKIEASHLKNNSQAMHNDVMLTESGDLFASDELIKIDNGALSKVWSNDSVTTNFQTGLVIGDYAYQFSNFRRKSNFNCIDLKTGNPVWNKDLGRWGSLIAVDNKLIIITGLGKVVIADASAEKYNQLAELQVLSSENKEENWCWTAPAFLDGKLYVRNSKGEMACINLKN